MTPARDLVSAIARALPNVGAGSLAVFGDVFGGRIDNIHTVRTARVVGDPERARVEFDGGESLEVCDPSDWEISTTAFRIRRASKVRWEWFYYGRPQHCENHYYWEHILEDGNVHATSNVDWHPPCLDPKAESNAVELLGPF